jgi:cephalosporin hydroxylase
MVTLLDRAMRGVGHPDRTVIEVLRTLRPTPDTPPQTVDLIARAASELWEPTNGSIAGSPTLRWAIVEQFHRQYYDLGSSTWQNTAYRGVTTWKCPLDLWIYQEILHAVKPGLIIETGTAYGGSALYLADLCELAGHGRVVTIDVRDRASGVDHPRITKVIGSSSDPEVRARVESLPPRDGGVIVILDADHSMDHVLAELRLWWDLVTPGSFLIVEDTNLNGHPVYPEFGPGPWEALDTFLLENDAFEIDESKHKFLMTWNPRGYLRRVVA